MSKDEAREMLYGMVVKAERPLRAVEAQVRAAADAVARNELSPALDLLGDAGRGLAAMFTGLTIIEEVQKAQSAPALTSPTADTRTEN